MFLTPKNSNACLQGIHLPVNLVSDFFCLFFFIKKKTTILNPKCSKMSPLYYTYFIRHQPMAAIADALTDNENAGQLALRLEEKWHGIYFLLQSLVFMQRPQGYVIFIFIIQLRFFYWKYQSQILSICYNRK